MGWRKLTALGFTVGKLVPDWDIPVGTVISSSIGAMLSISGPTFGLLTRSRFNPKGIRGSDSGAGAALLSSTASREPGAP